METITYRMAAKTDVGRVRSNNEDNFQVSDDLGGGKMTWFNNRVCNLGDKGALLVVADGMGGMNAGEVASEIAINTIRQYFAPERITDDITTNSASIESFMNGAIIEADNNIKAEAINRPETKGMGTTMVIGWLFRKHLYVSWCGDSRAYVFNPKTGLHQITKDHSYVQDLVDAKKLKPEDAFDFPESNIITRCLSDSLTKAEPDNLVTPYKVCNEDIIMLCTDGLSGLLRDTEIERIMSAYVDDMDAAVKALIDGACNAGGHDNITVCLCQILSGGAIAQEPRRDNAATPPISSTTNPISTRKHNNTPLVIIIILALILLTCGILFAIKNMKPKPESETGTVIDSVPACTDTMNNKGNKTDEDLPGPVIPNSTAENPQNETINKTRKYNPPQENNRDNNTDTTKIKREGNITPNPSHDPPIIPSPLTN